MGRMILTVDTSVAAVYVHPFFFTSILSSKNGDRYRGGDLISVVMGFLNLRTIRDLVLDRQDPQFKKLEKFLNKLRVDVRTGPGGERSRVKTIRGLEPFAGEFEFTNNEGRTMRVSVRTFFFLFFALNFRLFLDFNKPGLFSRSVQHPHRK
jgi:eukaryotic translation initiation factor 2C